METVPILEWAVKKDNDWKPKYYLGLIYWYSNNLSKAKELFQQCAMLPEYAPFYASRAALPNSDEEKEKDLEHAIQLDKDQWRYYKLLTENEILQKKYEQALSIVERYYKGHPENYIIGMLYAKTLMLNKKYKEADALLTKLQIIPFEGATDGRELYREAKLMQAVQEIKNKNYKGSLKFIDASKLWPMNLGVGKPYDEDIDERLENWLAYQNFIHLKNETAAQQMLDKIISFDKTKSEARINFVAANNL